MPAGRCYIDEGECIPRLRRKHLAGTGLRLFGVGPQGGASDVTFRWGGGGCYMVFVKTGKHKLRCNRWLRRMYMGGHVTNVALNVMQGWTRGAAGRLGASLHLDGVVEDAGASTKPLA
jgi:hypothetical protein